MHFLKDYQYKPREVNTMPSVKFDNLYGTSVSMRYDFSPYSEDEVWDMWLDCRNDGRCDEYMKVIDMLPKIFPYIDVRNMDLEKKNEILLGMVSGFNPEDIYYFSVIGIKYSQNIEQKELEGELPFEVGKNIGWVLSPGTMNKIRSKFGI